MNVKENYSLKPYNTLGISVIAEKFFEFENEEQLIAFVEKGMSIDTPIFILGGGSNVLFKKDFKGLVLHSNIQTIETIDENKETITLRVGSGLEWDKFVGYCVNNRYYGIENLSLIPGNVGAAPVQNIGAYGTEVEEVIEGVWAYDLDKKEKKYLSKIACAFQYRNSIFKRTEQKKLLITYVDFKLNKIPAHKRKIKAYKGGLILSYLKHAYSIGKDLIKAIRTLKYNKKSKSFGIEYRTLKNLLENLGFIPLKKVRETIINKRNSKIPSPKTIGNVGSFFKNPIVSKEKAAFVKEKYSNAIIYPYNENESKISAGWLIKQVDLPSGYEGRVGLYKNQYLIIVNEGKATGADVFNYSQKIVSSVQKKFDITLEREVVVV